MKTKEFTFVNDCFHDTANNQWLFERAGAMNAVVGVFLQTLINLLPC